MAEVGRQNFNLSAASAEAIKVSIDALGWDDESIADLARISKHVDLVTKLRLKQVTEVTKADMPPFLRLAATLGCSIKVVQDVL